MPKRVAILQSNYLPWKGYFDIIHDVDEFIFLDDVQYTRQNWRNRNRIKTPRGAVWLTIPVGTSLKRRICDVELPSAPWAAAHWNAITAAYAAAPYFETYRSRFETLFRRPWRTLTELNQELIRTLAADVLGIGTRFRDSREFAVREQRQERVFEILERTGADVYVSGPSGKSYLEPSRFAERGIELVWKSYDGYPDYPQFHPPFVHQVTILDLLFHTGPDAWKYIWGWRTA